MPLPIVYFLIAWAALLAILGLVALLSAIQMLRFGIAGASTTGVTFIFMAVGLTVTLATSAYLTTFDWKATIDPLAGITRESLLDNPLP